MYSIDFLHKSNRLFYSLNGSKIFISARKQLKKRRCRVYFEQWQNQWWKGLYEIMNEIFFDEVPFGRLFGIASINRRRICRFYKHILLCIAVWDGNPLILRHNVRPMLLALYKFSFFKVSMGFAFLILLIAYIMETNTTKNTLSTATPIAVHGRWKEVS